MVILTIKFKSCLLKLHILKLTAMPLFVYLFVNKPATQQFVYMGIHNIKSL